MACHDAPPSSGDLSNAQSSLPVASNHTASSSSSAPFKSIFKLNRKSKRKEDKHLLPPTGLPQKTSAATFSSSAKVPDIVIDPMTVKVAGDSPDDATPSESLDSPPLDGSLLNGGTTSMSTSVTTTEREEKLPSDFFSTDFEGVTVSTTKCLSCETETEQKETMIDLSIPISGHESLDALENPQAFFQSACITKEYFRGENKYRCEKCSAYTEAIRSISFEVLPRLLVVQLKRFSGGMEKINSFIPTPFVLQCFCRQCCGLPEEKRLHVYRLYSVITHVGATMSAGHYITYTSSLDCYCDYLDCEKEAEKWAKVMSGGGAGGGVNKSNNSAAAVSGVGGGGAAVMVDSNGGLMGNGSLMDYDLTDGKVMSVGGVTNLSNPGHNQLPHQPEKVGSNLIDKIKKNRLFKNKSSASSSSGLRAKFSLGGGGEKSVTSGHEVSVMNRENEMLERQLMMDTSSVNSSSSSGNCKKQIGVGGYQPTVCRSMNCCTIKAKGSFLVKQVASCAESRAAVGGVSAGAGGEDWNLYCNNARHHAKFGGGGSECGDSMAVDGGLTTSMSSSTSSSGTSVSLKQQLNGGGINGSLGGRTGGAIKAASAVGANVSDEPIWYMCDDDKIKSMPQHEFKELLGSNRKIAITPYLLFYARSDL